MTSWIKSIFRRPSESLGDESVDNDSPPPVDIGDEDESTEEHRVSPRIQLSAQVTVRSETNFFVGFSENISEGGMFISTKCPPDVGDRIELVVDIGEGETMVIEGEVRWHRTTDDFQVLGCGVQFVDLTPWARAALESMMERLKKEPLFFEM